MKLINDLFENIIFMRTMNTLITLVISFLLYTWFSNVVIKRLENNELKVLSGKKTKTYLKLLRSITKYIFIVVTILLLLQIYGVNINSLLAGIGILSVVIGLAIQDFLKDIIRGSSIISDNYFSVGDVVKYKDIEGKVLTLGLKTTKIQDLKTSNIISIANRNIEEIQVVSDVIYVKIPMPYEVSVEKAEKAVEDIIEIVKSYDDIKDCIYKGVTELADSSVEYFIQVKCNPVNKLQVRRDTLRSILIGLAKNNIEVPYKQIDIHNK